MSTESLYVGNVAPQTSSESLMKAFLPYGCVRVNLTEGRNVVFLDVASDRVEDAISQMNGIVIDGAPLRVSKGWGAPKPDAHAKS